jgi:hypothetical protein
MEKDKRYFPACYSLDDRTVATVERIARETERNRSQTLRLLIREGAKAMGYQQQEGER